MTSQFFRTATKIAWRDARASSGKFLFVIIAVGIGVGALTGVRGFSQALASMLLKEARVILGGDILVRANSVPTTQQQAEIDSLVKRGAKTTRVTETFSMVSTGPNQVPLPATVKAVDPNTYPLYGELQLDPDKPAAQLLKPDTIAVTNDLRIRLNVGIGSTLRVGAEAYRIAAFIAGEPDRLVGGPGLGPRVIMSQDALARTGLISLGSRAQQRIVFRLPASMDLKLTRDELKKTFNADHIADYRDANQNITRSIDFCTSFLSLVSLIALIVGGVGVATTMHAHLKQRMDSIAIMKCIGGRAGQIMTIYVMQTMILGFAGGLLGIAIGSLVQQVFPPVLLKLFQIHATVPWVPSSALQGLLTGLLTTLLFTVPTLLSIRKIHPNLIFRRDMPEVRRSWRTRLADSKPIAFSGGLILICIAALAMWLIGGEVKQAARIGGYFVGGLLTSLIVLAAVAWLLLRGLRMFIAAFGTKLPPSVRHGVANLYRPGSQSTAILTALGVGVTFTLTVYLVQHSILSELRQTAPPGMPNVFMLDITPAERDSLPVTLAKVRGVEHAPELLGTVSARIVDIDGVRPEDYRVDGEKRRFLPRRVVSSLGDLPPNTKIVKGAWWHGTPPQPEVSVSDWAAHYFGLKIGSTIDWDVFGRQVRTRVAAIHQMDPHRLRARLEFFFTPGTLEGVPTVYYGAVRAKPSSVPELQRVLFDKYPTVTVINMADVIDRIQEVINEVSLVIRFISGFAILAGATILASSVAGTRFRRIREVVIFKTLGATRARVAQIFSAEFLILGSIAGLMGTLLATGFSNVVVRQIIKIPFRFDVAPDVFAIVGTALIAAIAGWLACYRILGQKPLEILRDE